MRDVVFRVMLDSMVGSRNSEGVMSACHGRGSRKLPADGILPYGAGSATRI